MVVQFEWSRPRLSGVDAVVPVVLLLFLNDFRAVSLTNLLSFDVFLMFLHVFQGVWAISRQELHPDWAFGPATAMIMKRA